jgi:hypothetical protein
VELTYFLVLDTLHSMHGLYCIVLYFSRQEIKNIKLRNLKKTSAFLVLTYCVMRIQMLRFVVDIAIRAQEEIHLKR